DRADARACSDRGVLPAGEPAGQSRDPARTRGTPCYDRVREPPELEPECQRDPFVLEQPALAVQLAERARKATEHGGRRNPFLLNKVHAWQERAYVSPRKAFNGALVGWVRRVRLQESDGDWHVELTAAPATPVDSCIIVEIPAERYGAIYRGARAALASLVDTTRLGPRGDLRPPVRVRFTGAAFF